MKPLASISIGIDRTDAMIRAVAINVRSGEVVARANNDVVSKLLEAAGIEMHQVVGVATTNESLPRHHAQFIGAGVAAPSTMVLIFGEEPAQLMNSRVRAAAPAVAKFLEAGILPGYFGYELIADPALRGESDSAAMALRRKCDVLRVAGVPVRRFVATGEFRDDSSPIIQTFANVLGEKIRLCVGDEIAARGAAIFAALKADPDRTGHASMSQLIHTMAPDEHDRVYRPELSARRHYDRFFRDAE